MRRIALGVAIACALIAVAVLAMRTATKAHDETRPSAVDIGFAQDMVVHHQQAVLMAAYTQQHAESAEVRSLAAAINSSQQREIGQLVGWLQSWGQPEQTDRAPMTWMASGRSHDMSDHMSASRHGGLMPGMATPAQMDKLVNLTGKPLDTEFLTLMIRHHEGGLPMAEDAAFRAHLPYVRGAARTMIQDQQREIDLMQTLLAPGPARAG